MTALGWVLVGVSLGAITVVLIVAALGNASATVDSRLAQIDLDREPFDPDTERAIAQAIALPNQAAPLAAVHWEWDKLTPRRKDGAK